MHRAASVKLGSEPPCGDAAAGLQRIRDGNLLPDGGRQPHSGRCRNAQTSHSRAYAPLIVVAAKTKNF